MYSLVLQSMLSHQLLQKLFWRYLTEKEIRLWDSEQGPEGRCKNKWPVMICSTQSERKDNY